MGFERDYRETKRALLLLLSRWAVSGRDVLHSHSSPNPLLPREYHDTLHFPVHDKRDDILASAGLGWENRAQHHRSARILCVHAPHSREHTGHEWDGAVDWHLPHVHHELNVFLNCSHRFCAAAAPRHSLCSAHFATSLRLYHNPYG